MEERHNTPQQEEAMSTDTMGGRIAAARKQKNLTQQQLADRLGVTNKAVSKWETNEGCPDIKTVPALCEALELTADQLLTGAPALDPAPLTFWAFCERHRERIRWYVLGGCIGAILGILAYNHNWL